MFPSCRSAACDRHTHHQASAPVRFYAQQVDPFAYYEVVTKSAERAVPGCPAAVRSALTAANALSMADTIAQLGICPELPAYIDDVSTLRDELNMVVMYSHADLNMENYPYDPNRPPTRLP